MQIDTSDPIITSSLNKSSQPDDPLLAEAEPSPAAEDDEAPMDIGANTEVIDLSNLSVSRGNSTGGETDLDRRRRRWPRTTGSATSRGRQPARRDVHG